MTSEENDYCRLLPTWSWYVVAPFVMADNKQWKGRWGEDVGSEGYWRTAYPSFVIVLLWLGLAYLHFFHIFTSMIFSFSIVVMIGLRALLSVSICYIHLGGTKWNTGFLGSIDKFSPDFHTISDEWFEPCLDLWPFCDWKDICHCA